MLVNISIIILSFLAMEGVAWFTHKYIMHGILWSWHESHHKPRHGRFEKNDLFAVVFSLPAIFLIILGSMYADYEALKFVGIGITLYGIFYTIFHDIIVHKRIKWKLNSEGTYLAQIIQAHRIHHQKMTKSGCESFGFLFALKKFRKLS